MHNLFLFDYQLDDLIKIGTIILFLPTSILYLMKLYEFIKGMNWAWKYGFSYADDLSEAINRWKENKFDLEEFEAINERHHRIWSPSRWSASRFFYKLNSPLKEISMDFVFRFPTLTLILAFVLFLPSYCFVLISGVILICLGLWIITVHSIVYRITHGYVDNYFARTVSMRMLPYPDPQPSELNPSRRKLIKEFAKVFVSLLTLVVIGYAGIYTGINSFFSPREVFTGIENSWTVPLDFLYFSIVTLATVGFGDISPAHDATFARLAVASEIMNGFFLIIFLLTSFTLTMEAER